MAAATLLNPATGYHPHSQPFPSPYHQPHPPSVISNTMSPGESKRPSNEAETGLRQSLPSISEVFNSAAKPSPYSPTTQSTLAGSQSLPLSYASVVPPPRPEPGPEPRSLPAHDEKYLRYPPRPEPGHSQGPQSSYSFPEQRDSSTTSESTVNGSHINSQPPPPMPYPPGQLPFSAAPAAARHHGPLPPYDPHRPPPPRADEEYGVHRNRYDTTLNRHFESWGYSDCLGKIGWSARTISSFAEAYANLASEQHGGQPIPERLPSEAEVSHLISVAHWLKGSLENVRDIVQQSLAEKARDSSRNKAPGYDGDDDISMYGDSVKPSFGLGGEVKKRRGRAAPPGRCHSCNRVDTPEWRRGPDGARTLCNACGLHYAKLERKRQMEQRSIRPKAVEERP
ncbi:hypothetical protein F5Y19DRAFT_474888 [Xylariaceae sp. FL1651]|nr:hypothetical protein F5Y19DRAFT_474888 [Xylariaceae sp. FL1651]